MSEIDPDAFTSHDHTLLEHAARGITLWSRVTDTVIVTTRPESINPIYKTLLARRPPNIKIIGGFKTTALPGVRKADARPYDFADPDTWRDLAAKARRVAHLTGVNVVVLENETALNRFHTGRADIDTDRLASALKPLADTGIQFWWALPSVLPDSRRDPNRRARTQRLVRAVARAVPNSLFLTTHGGWKAWRTDSHASRDLQTMSRIVGPDRLIDMLYVQPDGFVHYSLMKKKRCYTPAESISEMANRATKTCIIYPGAANWVTVADQFIRLLPGAEPDANPAKPNRGETP